jgi:DNA replication and repair protein RecF
MTRLSHISIHHLRNLSAVDLYPSPKINLLCGPNGSGKTSFLEALYLLGLGRSFRHHLNSRLIQHEQAQFQLHAKVASSNGDTAIGLAKQRDGQTVMRLAGNPVSSIVPFAELLPIQLLYPDGHSLLRDLPKLRRQFIDWGLFHVEHLFYNHWQRAQRAIKQRNAALRAKVSLSEATIWDHELCSVSEHIDNSRSRYIEKLIPLLNSFLETLLPETPLTVNYYRGWSHELSLSEVLGKQYHRDQDIGYTQFGPHRADIHFRTQGHSARDTLSQGQHKTLIYALRLAQGALLHFETNRAPLYLIDDLPAELDETKLKLVVDCLDKINAQVFITGTEAKYFEPLNQYLDFKMFHVKHGCINELP